MKSAPSGAFPRYLPNRQLRKASASAKLKTMGYLPNRQLRKALTTFAEIINGYLPNRQLRKDAANG